MEGDAVNPIRFQSIPLPHVVLDTGPDGMVDHVYRERMMKNEDIMIAYPNAVLTNFLEKDREPGEPLIYVEGAQTWSEFAEANNPYAIGMAAAKKKYDDEPPLKKRTIKKAHEMALT